MSFLQGGSDLSRDANCVADGQGTAMFGQGLS